MRPRIHSSARALGAVAAVLMLGTGLGACSGSDSPDDAGASTTPTTTPSSTAPPPPRATPVPDPETGVCYRLSYDDAIAPTATSETVPCERRHTAETFAVGSVANVVDGHLLAIDSDRVQDRVADACPGKLGAAVGGTPDDLRLSMLRAVWFTPTLEESDSGADWYRCDVVVLDGAEDLATVRGSLDGVLDTQEGRDTYGMCGTAGPDDPAFERVRCADPHSWRAFAIIDLPDGKYPGPAAIRTQGDEPCRDRAAEIADDALDFEWGFEGPDKDQWVAGQTFIRCWSPSG